MELHLRAQLSAASDGSGRVPATWPPAVTRKSPGCQAMSGIRRLSMRWFVCRASIRCRAISLRRGRSATGPLQSVVSEGRRASKPLRNRHTCGWWLENSPTADRWSCRRWPSRTATASANSSSERSRCSIVLAWATWYLGHYDELRSTMDALLSSADAERLPALATSVAPLLDWLGETSRSPTLPRSHRGAARRSNLAGTVCPPGPSTAGSLSVVVRSPGAYGSCERTRSDCAPQACTRGFRAPWRGWPRDSR